MEIIPAPRACELPAGSLLLPYRDRRAYTDCYCVVVPNAVTQERFVEAFYTTWLFKLERRLLARLMACPSTDRQASELAQGELDGFAAWRVEKREADQLLLTDIHGRTRSWLMSGTEATDSGSVTILYFGSAVVPLIDRRTGRRTMGLAFRALLGCHRLYSRALLRAAAARLAAEGIERQP